jgi:hypothetical protein
MEQKMEKILEKPLKIPIVHVGGTQYLVGIKFLNCELIGDQVQIRVGGGYDTLKQYVQTNYKAAQKNLAKSMIANHLTLQ